MTDVERIKELARELITLLEATSDWQLIDTVVSAITYKDLEELDEI